MIPVLPQDEPTNFDESVRRPGIDFLRDEGVPPEKKLKKGKKLRPYWRLQLPEMHTLYSGTCAYLGVYIERCTGGNSVDHFTPKSKDILLAYEWQNYRLASSTLNSKKRDLIDLVDPFHVIPNSFILDLLTGHISASPDVPAAVKNAVRNTIKKLDLNRFDFQKLRSDFFSDYIAGDISNDYLRRKAPFIWHEADRQGLL